VTPPPGDLAGERMTTAEVIRAISRERTRLFAAVDDLGERATSATTTDEGWTAKDVLAHLIHWATQLAGGLGEPVAPPAYMLAERRRRQELGMDDRMPTGEEANALAVAYYRDVPLADLRIELARLIDAIAGRVAERSDEQMNATDAVPWAGERPLWRFIGGDTFLHWPAHAEAMERAAAVGG